MSKFQIWTQHQSILFCEQQQAWYQFYTKIKQWMLLNAPSVIFLYVYLTWSGAMIPGQFGPINRLLLCLVNACLTRTISCWGIPSVIQTINPISASIAGSKIGKLNNFESASSFVFKNFQNCYEMQFLYAEFYCSV